MPGDIDIQEKTLPKTDPQFTFQRMGGINQAILTTDYDWQNLDKLDPKLWMALSCPIHGLEFDAATLEALDLDQDGRIRAQEVKESVRWVCARVAHPSILAQGKTQVSLADLRDDTPEGRAVASALEIALKKYDKTESLELAEIEEVLAEAASYAFNGDGIITVDSADYEAGKDQVLKEMPEFIRLAIACVGAKKDASGTPGIDGHLVKEFCDRLLAVDGWRKKMAAADLPLDEKTGEAWTLLQKLAPKLDDYFYRCQVAAYAPDTLPTLNEDKFAQSLVAGQNEETRIQVDNELLSTLPIARINPEGSLDLSRNINPAWQDDIRAFSGLFAPLLKSGKGGTVLDAENWKNILSRFGEYEALLKSRPVYAAPPEDAVQKAFPGLPMLAEAPADDPLARAFMPLDPNEAIGNLTDDQVKWLLGTDAKNGIDHLLQLDLDAPSLTSFKDLRKLALFHGHLYTFLMNFLSFMDFYNPDKKAIFQSGTLYLDSRACSLCVPVQDIDAHARLADPSHLCLIYCDCFRKEADGAESSGSIAAALTQGHLAGLLDGRHGLFIDNDGKEWDTRIARIVHNPVSLEEAVWSPYIRIGNMITEQIQKFVASKDEAITKMAGNAVAKAATPQPKPAPDAKPGFDFAKGAGIFAAVSVAVSVLSAAFAYIANSLASLGWWWPLALVLVFICISGPSVFMAWLKLRRRSLGPLLDASGWAVNQGAPINLAMGASLTSTAKLPPNAKCDTNDPYSLPGQMLRKKWRNRIWLLVILLVIAAIAGFMLYCNLLGEPLWLFRLRAMLGI